MCRDLDGIRRHDPHPACLGSQREFATAGTESEDPQRLAADLDPERLVHHPVAEVSVRLSVPVT